MKYVNARVLSIGLLACAFVSCGGGTTAGVDPVPNPKEGAGPAITLSATLEGFVTGGTQTLTTDIASSALTVNKVEFYSYRNGVKALINTDNDAPYSYSFNTLDVANGAYTYSAKLYASDGSTSASNEIKVSINH